MNVIQKIASYSLISLAMTLLISVEVSSAEIKAVISKDANVRQENLFQDDNILNSFIELDELYLNDHLNIIPYTDFQVITSNDLKVDSEVVQESNLQKVHLNQDQDKDNNFYNLSLAGKNKLLINKTKQLIKNKQLRNAELNLDNIISKSNNYWDIAEVATLYAKLNNLDKSKRAFQKALSLNPERLELLYSYSLCLCKVKDFNNAKNQLNKIIQINPNFMLAHYELGNIYFHQSDFVNALKEFSTSMKLNPMNSDVLYNTALTLEVMNHKSLAEKYYAKCLELNPNDKHAVTAIKRLNQA